MKSKNLLYTTLLLGGVLVAPNVMMMEDVHASASTTHKVEKGDTIYKLSIKYKTTVDNLKKLNNLKSDTIKIGQVLKLNGSVVTNKTSTQKVTPKKLSVSTNTNVQTPSKVSSLITNAKALKGTKYVWGGTTTKGFDCSGFVQYVYKKSGIELPRTTAEMSKQGTTISSKSQLKEGDLVFFATGAKKHKITHVGIYMGNNQVVHATTSNGVSVTNINDKYWGNKFIKGQRLNNFN